MTTFGGQSLMRHINHNDVSAVVSLLQSGNINLDERDENGQTFLMVACQLGNDQIVSELLAMDHIDVNSVDNDNWTALLNAAKHNYINICKKLLDNGASIDHKDMSGWTPLMWSSYLGYSELTGCLLERDANCNLRSEHNMTCLAWAAGRGFTTIVKILLENSCKVNTVDKYGTTPLIWASRKGHVEIAKLLLSKGATVDNSGMNAWTALIAAAKGGYTDVVSALLEYDPNVNMVDKDGYSALAWASKDGYREIVNMLLHKGSYVNTPERQRDSLLILAVKGGHQDVVYALLKKHADVNVEGEDNKTALYWAVEKNHIGNVRLLLEHKANTEIANKDGDTPLLKAVRNRNTEVVELLLSKGARVSATDKKGDTSLHISVRALSKRVTELLLRNPKDGKLLYKPNRAGETPYMMDAAHPKSILTQIFGARHLNAEESIQGYDLYSSTIADVLSDPTLCTPITLGLYAKWGSGKSILIRKLQREMIQFTSHRPDVGFEFSVVQFCFSVLLAIVAGLVFSIAFNWIIGLAVAGGVFLMQYLILAFLWFGANYRTWQWAEGTSVYLAKKINAVRLLLQVIFCNMPGMPDKETATVRFLFTDNARLASVVGEKSISLMISTLLEAVEQEYGTVVTRLFRVFKPAKASEYGKYKTVCCIPNVLIVIFVVLCMIASAVLISIYGIHNIYNEKYTAVDSVLISFAIIIGVALLGNTIMWSRMLYNIVMSPGRRLSRISSHLSKVKMEGFLQQLKKEVEQMGHCVKCIDSFSGTCTRLVVIVDGLDSCEQDKLLQVLDTVHMLFGEEESPFVTILAVDPHVVIKGIEQHIHGIFRDSSINGHDYLRNIVHLPFFLQNASLPRNPQIRESVSGTVSKNRHDSVVSGSSALQLSAEPGSSSGGGGMRGGKQLRRKGTSPSSSMSNVFGSGSLIKHASTFDLNKTLMKNMYFSDINPRNMRRLMNIVAVTGRLLRAFKIDFSFYRLVSWINVTEQWPYRLSWIILESEDNDELDPNTSLKEVYDKIVDKIPTSKDIDPLVEIDRNAQKLEIFLAQHKSQLTLTDLRKFLFCTINVDPYLRKLIKELQHTHDVVQDPHQLYPSLDSSGAPTQLWQPVGRRPLSRVDTASPRATPTRASSRLGQNHFQFPSVAPSPAHHHITSPIPPPHHPAVGGTALSAHQSGAATPLVCNQHCTHHMCSQYLHPQAPRPHPATATGATSKQHLHKLRIEGDAPEQQLSDMTVDDICEYTSRLRAVSQQHMATYQQRIKELNISGLVLSTCDIAELKGEISMSFGDWELFKAMIVALREKEQEEQEKNVEFREKLERIPSMNETSQENDTTNFSQELSKSDAAPLQVPQAHYPKGRTRSSFGDIHSPIALGEEGPSTSGHIGRKWTNSPLKVNIDGGKMKRKDSFLGEIIFEHQAIKTVMSNMGMPDSSEDELDEEQSTTTEGTEMLGSSVTSTVSRFPDDFIIPIPEEENAKQAREAENKTEGLSLESGKTHTSFTLFDSNLSLNNSQSTDTVGHSESKSTATTTAGEIYMKNELSGSVSSIEDTALLLSSPSSATVKLLQQQSETVAIAGADSSGIEIGARPPSGGESHGPSAFKVVTPYSSCASSRAASRASVKAGSYGSSTVSQMGSLENVRLPRRDSVSSRRSSIHKSRPVSVSSEASPGKVFLSDEHSSAGKNSAPVDIKQTHNPVV